MPGPRLGHDPDDRAQVPGERRERLRDRLLVADVGEDVAPDRQPAAGRGRDVQPGLVHEAEQPERPQRDGLAAGVRAGDDERRVAVAEPDVDRDDPAGQARMAGRQQDDLGPVGGLGPDAVHAPRPGCALAAHRSKRASASSVSRSGPALAATSADSSSRMRAISSGLGDLRLAPGVAELDRDERLDEQGLAAARRVVDDALDPRPGLGLDRDDVAAVAQGDDRLLEGAAELRADERVEPSAQPVVGDPDGRPEAAQPRRGRVEQLPDRVEAAGERAAQRRQRVQLASRGRAAAAAARRRATSRAAPSHRACRRSRGTGPGRGARRGPPARSPGRCRAPPPIADPGPLARGASGSGRSRRGRGRR